ncbi:MAG: polysaccharide biosynthesis/export family protein [Elainellaceae cyanobacterium]
MLSPQKLLFTTIASLLTASVSLPSWALPLSPGDRVRISVPGDQELPEVYRFSGIYEVNLDGYLQIPYLRPMPVAGLELEQVEQELASAFIGGGFFRAETLQLSADILQWAPIQVNVSGETFVPGRVYTGARLESEPITALGNVTPTNVSGNYAPSRYLTEAIRLAGGVKPTADVRNVRIIRGDQEQVVDLSGVFTGEPVEDIALISGDRVIIEDTGTFQNELVRPSQITPSAIAVFLSNQTVPRGGGATGGEVAQLEYGTRFSQAAIGSFCGGGTRSVNANRRVALVRTDRTTGETSAVERKIEDIIDDSSNNEDNPYLMPGDGIVCYDSRVTNISAIFDFIGNIFAPVRILDQIFFD